MELPNPRQDPDPPTLVPLPGSASWAAPSNWAEAQEFVPQPKVEKPRSWAQVVNTGVTYPGCEVGRRSWRTELKQESD